MACAALAQLPTDRASPVPCLGLASAAAAALWAALGGTAFLLAG
jgi:hypothetical protein